jgi:hypothetical protein
VRLAGGPLRLFREAKHFALPSGALETLGRFGPDLLFSGLYATQVPQGYANTPERVGLFAEDFTTQAIPGVLASGLTGIAARRMGVKPATARHLAGGVDTVVSMTAPMFAGQMGLRPVSAHLDARAQKNAELQAQLEREGIFQQGLNAAAERFSQTPMALGLDYTLNNLYGQG